MAEGGGIVFTFNSVNGNTGISRTNVAQLDNGDPLLYSDISLFNGHVNVHQSSQDLIVVAQGDIGMNAN